jgi:small subunit ribosomal protein S5
MGGDRQQLMHPTSPSSSRQVVVGDENGTVGVGCASAKEVMMAVKKAIVDAKRNLISVPLTKNASFPHRFDGIFGAAKVMLRPASEGTGVIAGGAVRTVLEMAGVKNAFGKQLGTSNPLNNARATIQGLQSMRTFESVAALRDVPIETLLPPRKAREAVNA